MQQHVAGFQKLEILKDKYWSSPEITSHSQLNASAFALRMWEVAKQKHFSFIGETGEKTLSPSLVCLSRKTENIVLAKGSLSHYVLTFLP